MDYATFVQAAETHSEGLEKAAVAAGADAPVPSCPGWTMRRLVRHIARVHSSVAKATNDPSGTDVRGETAPEDWDALLSWWQEQRRELRTLFSRDPNTPAWLPFPSHPQRLSSWARRMAHEAAIHRLDAELALTEETTEFDPEFAADGIDELLMMLVYQHHDWANDTTDGTVLVHTNDADRVWAVHMSAGHPPRFAQQPPEPDVMIEGTADAVYRAVWRRPSTVTITGDRALLEPLTPP